MAVLVGHFGSLPLINFGRLGVELFFVLSGRLMAEILFVRGTPLSTFFPRRISRVYPALLVLATAMFATALWRGIDPTLPQFMSAITFTANYAHFSLGRSEVLDHIWSLCVEEHMYVLLGAMAFVHRRTPLPVAHICAALAIIAMGSGAIQTAAGLDYYTVYWRTDVRGASILVGVVSYLALRDDVPAALSSKWAPLAFGALGLMFNLYHFPDPIKYSLGTAALAMSLVLMHRAPRLFLACLEHPLLLRVGVWSYSIYLWQQPFFKLGEGTEWQMVCVVPAVLVGIASYYWIEQPARRFLNQLVELRRSSAASA